MRDKSIELIIDLEGGYNNVLADRGGETKFGISKKAFPDLDIPNLTLEAAKQIYKEQYWDAVKGDLLPAGLSLIVMDAAINHGVFKATTLLQRCLHLKEDGMLGPQTIQATLTAVTPSLIVDYALERHVAYTKNEQWEKFGKGWSKRLLIITAFSALYHKGF